MSTANEVSVILICVLFDGKTRPGVEFVGLMLAVGNELLDRGDVLSCPCEIFRG